MKKKKIKKNTAEQRVNIFQAYIIIAFIVILLLSIFIVILNSLSKSSTVLKNQVTSLVQTIDQQMEINIDNYLQKIEDTSTLVFSDTTVNSDKDITVYQYNPIKDKYQDYEKTIIESNISNKLVDISLMENYCDFVIVYSDNSTIGKLSKNTSAKYANNLYETLTPIVTRKRTNDGWFAKKDAEFVRLFYAKRLNDDAILLTSFYMTELENIFARPETLDKMVIRLSDSDQTIVYSSNEDEIGSQLSDDMKELSKNYISKTVSNDDYIASINECGNGWKIICSIPTSEILKGNTETRNYTILIGLVASILSVAAVIIITRIMTRPVKGIVENLNTKADTDLLTGIYNKISYEEEADKIIHERNGNNCFWIIDIDNFKHVNDTKGHAFGDEVIRNVAAILRENVGEKGIEGRIGGDEFSVLLNIPENMKPFTEKYTAYVNDIYNRIREDLESFSTKVDYNVTLSIGTAGGSTTYKDAYAAADKNLYYSKNNGKNRITIG